MKKKYLLLVEFEGTAYHGWQMQTNALSIQEVVEKALSRITNTKTTILSSGRTDAGVHAEGMPAHFVTESKMTAGQIQLALNSLLPHDITIREVREVSIEFHARGSAKNKLYRYTILNRDYPSALNFRRSWFIPHELDFTAMQEAASYLVGEHDFTSFRAGNCNAKSPVRTMLRAELYRDGDYLQCEFEGKGFLKHMVRNFIGTLVYVGKGKYPASEIKTILSACDRKVAGPTAPPEGLCLIRVEY
ncbi:MAG: tRNA pseudouridine(38-40) synthase TruA [Nitrospinaceae bacterium]|nr:tRNA pseudouridine(38-40) synthase TruA [Nitrospinaceae bacterium]MBT5867638.1 tRNA pseudouridine(38-40) synthase TruA [Nitrospinaceae bacterium]MBT6347415.1 tRNA pseudouridine(38-40) synthase TruA [Nitrospina sp.]